MRAGLVAQGADTDSDLEGNLSEVRGPSWRKRLPRKELRIRRQLPEVTQLRALGRSG